MRPLVAFTFAMSLASLAMGSGRAAAQSIGVIAPVVTAAPGSTVDLPIETVPGPAGLGIVAAQIRMELGASIVQSSSFVTGEGWLWTWGAPARNANAGFAVAAAAGTTPVPAGTNRLATVRVVIRPDAPVGSDLPLVLSIAQFNEGTPAAEVTHGVLRIRTGTVDVPAGVQGRLALSAPSPNPARDAVRFGLRVAQGGPMVRLAIVGLDGRLVRTLAEESIGAGEHERVWDLRDERLRAVPPGLYLAVLESARERHVRRIAVVR